MPEEIKFDYRYSVQVLRSGQPRPYANTEREFKIYCERYQGYGLPPDKDKWHPFYPPGTAGNEVDSNGVPTNKYNRDLLDRFVKGVTQNYYREEDNDPAANWASPFLKWMRINREAGTIHLFITEEYTD